ncbi:MAG: hypothetical protein ACOX6X_01060 [Dethiobacteria bacterium]|jgi:stage III sporulation protein AB
MYVKFLGAALIVAAAYLYGCQVSFLYSKRVRLLEEILMALEMFLTEVNYGLTPLPQAFSQLGKKVQKPIGSLFCDAARCMKQKRGLSARECWEEALLKNASAFDFNKHQLDLFQRLGGVWGRGDREGQQKQIALMQNLLRQALQEAQVEEQKNVKVWRYLGLIGGLTIVVFLL